MARVIHFCECGNVAIAQNPSTGDWRCGECIRKEALSVLAMGMLSKLGDKGISDVMVVPGDDGDTVDVLAPLHEAVAIRMDRN
jgi:hypothetical protein